MKVYFKSGVTVRVDQKVANELVEMITNQAGDTGGNVLVQRHFISKNVFSYFDITEIIAIK